MGNKLYDNASNIIFWVLVILVFLLSAFLLLLLCFPEECCVGGIENVEIVRCLFGIKAFNFVNIGTAFGGLVILLLYQFIGNRILLFLLFFLVGVSFVLFIIGILIEFGLSEDVNCSIIQALSVLYEDEKKNVYTLMNVGIAFGGLMTLLFYQLRNQATEKQTKTQYETFNQDKQFSNYLEATKLLTDKKSTPDAKIAAMFSLAGVARDHHKDVSRIVQVINQSLILRKNLQENSKETSKETIKSWRHTGDFVERTFSTALYVIRKIILGLQSSNTNVDISNTIIFDVDTDFYEEAIKIDTLFSVVGKERPVENLTFFHCKLEKIDIIKEARYHFCQFINCNLTKANFNKANLWGTSFIDCDLEGAKFKNTECEGVKFTECKNLSLKQLKQMKFENREEAKGYEFKNIQNVRLYWSKNKGKNKESYSKKDLKYLVVIDEKTREEINKSIKEKNKKLKMENFITRNEYDEWKNSAKIDNDDKNKKSSRK